MNKKPDYKPKKVDPKIVIAVASVIGLFVSYRLIIIAPQFFFWMAVFITIAVILFYLYRNSTRLIFPTCPHCGDIMDIFTRNIAFKGAEDKETKKPYSAIALEICQCPKCGNRHMKLRYANLVRGDSSDYSFRMKYAFVNKFALTTTFKSEIPYGINIPDEITISAADYQRVLKELKAKVIHNNLKAGFPDNPKDIKLK